ncbi:MAG TPA: hypothetical protein VGE20_21510 [Ramlibacter sp.]
MNGEISGKDAERAKAEHGATSEVNWDGGQGRQPYENQDDARQSGPAAGHEAAEGDRGAASGRNLEQLEQIKRKP